MTTSLDELSWWRNTEPTEEELYLGGGLQVEDWPHARQVMRLSTALFEVTQPLHTLDVQAQHMLERAALLHNSGMLVESRRHHKHSFRLINETRLPDFSDEERYEIACIARYHRRALPSSHHEEFAALSHAAQQRVSTLAALLRVADALDFNHDGRILHLTAEPERSDKRVWTVLLKVRPLADLDAELEHAYAKADLFEIVFKRKLRLIVQE